jgi:Lrp/AsnC family transcriptional regulator, leucine-responsive regulatory protein
MASTRRLPSPIDQIDQRIIAALRSEGRLSVAELARRVGVSKTPCQVRLRRLMDAGYILGFRAVIDPQLFGLNHVAFTEVKLSDTREGALEEFRRGVLQVAEVEECHMIAGGFDFLLKVRTRDILRYRQVLGEKLSSLPHVASTSTYVSMETIRDVQV